MPISITTKETMQKRYMNPPALCKPSGYTHVVSVSGGRMVSISGQVAYNQEGKVVGKAKLAVQTKQVYDNVAAALAAAKASFADVVKMTVFVVDLTAAKAKIIREVRSEYVSADMPPASTMVGVTGLVHPDLLIEIEAVAFLPLA